VRCRTHVQAAGFGSNRWFFATNRFVFASEQMTFGSSRKTVVSDVLSRRESTMKPGVTPAAIGLLLMSACLCAGAATAEAKAVYKQAQDEANASYTAARARCDALSGNPKAVCVEESRAARVRRVEEAGALYKNTLKAYTQSRLTIASANYELDKAKCRALAGNDKDVCVQQAKATLIAAQADARADKKAIEARTDARDDKRTAEYNVAREKCDAFAGAARDSCISAAKSQYGK
jgi:hypothetical protein